MNTLLADSTSFAVSVLYLGHGEELLTIINSSLRDITLKQFYPYCRYWFPRKS